MAANLDKAETSLTAVSDIAYIRGIDGSGNSVRISKADLASVLGGSQECTISDFNTFLNESTIYFFVTSGNETNIPNAPTTEKIRGYLRNRHLATAYKEQEFVDINYPNAYTFYHRLYRDGVWGNWYRIYDESLLTKPALLSPLASALGGLTEKGSLSNSEQDTTFTTGYYRVNGTAATSCAADWGILIVMGWGVNNIITQFKIPANYQHGTVFKRDYYNNQWHDWRKIVTEAV
jgi:hypothetical protein